MPSRDYPEAAILHCCPTDAEWVDYLASRVEEKLSAIMTTHLESCPHCREVLADAQAFGAADPAVLEPQVEAALRAVKGRLGILGKREWLPWAVAAALAIGCGLSTLWALRVGIQTTAEQKKLTAEIQRKDRQETDLRAQLDAARRPLLNIEIRDLFPIESRMRSAGATRSPTVTAKRDEWITLILNSTRAPGQQADLELIDVDGKTVRRETGLVQKEGSFRWTIRADLLPPGKYTLLLRKGETVLYRYEFQWSAPVKTNGAQ